MNPSTDYRRRNSLPDLVGAYRKRLEAEGVKPPQGLRHSERELWWSTEDEEVRVVLARLSRLRLNLRSL